MRFQVEMIFRRLRKLKSVNIQALLFKLVTGWAPENSRKAQDLKMETYYPSGIRVVFGWRLKLLLIVDVCAWLSEMVQLTT